MPLSNPAQLQGAQSVRDSQAAATTVSNIIQVGELLKTQRDTYLGKPSKRNDYR